jgi:RHS repeat-associated protein
VWQKVSIPNEAPVETYFLYDGDTLIAEVGLVDNEWQVVAEYVWGPLGPLMQRRYNPGTETWYNYYYVQDGLGHTRLLLDGNGNVKNRYAYDAWGNLIEYEEAVPNSFTWNGAYGYEWIPLTGLYHVGAREYDPRTGRWLQRDPIEASSGDPHFWRYCGNDPLNGVDPSGLWATGSYLGDVGAVFKGYGKSIVGLFTSPWVMYEHFRDHGVSWDSVKNLVVGGIQSIGNGLSGDDPEAFGEALGTVLMMASPALKKIPSPKWGRGPKGNTVPLYRAVKDSELANIKEAGGFSNPCGIESKYFSTTSEGAARYAQLAYEAWPHEGPYTIVSTNAPLNIIGEIIRVDGGIPTVVIPTEHLPLLGPPQISPHMPIPWRR